MRGGELGCYVRIRLMVGFLVENCPAMDMVVDA